MQCEDEVAEREEDLLPHAHAAVAEARVQVVRVRLQRVGEAHREVRERDAQRAAHAALRRIAAPGSQLDFQINSQSSSQIGNQTQTDSFSWSTAQDSTSSIIKSLGSMSLYFGLLFLGLLVSIQAVFINRSDWEKGVFSLEMMSTISSFQFALVRLLLMTSIWLVFLLPLSILLTLSLGSQFPEADFGQYLGTLAVWSSVTYVVPTLAFAMSLSAINANYYKSGMGKAMVVSNLLTVAAIIFYLVPEWLHPLYQWASLTLPGIPLPNLNLPQGILTEGPLAIEAPIISIGLTLVLLAVASMCKNEVET